WKIQILAIRLLSETKDLRAAELIMNVLQYPFFTNDCPALKWNAAIALGNFGNERRIVNTLIDTLHDRDLYVREASIQSLGKIGNADAVPHLISALSDSSFAIKLSAINALGKIGSPAAIPYLRRIVDNDGDEYIKNEALSALKRLELK
ncbi:MAG: HEAT repeat domain-containing protein, partial [Nitrospirae bacterium]|nr:HEAT repeat domain-containing protein [Nitrospirota bacterium]